jgi:hypothetical protein
MGTWAATAMVAEWSKSSTPGLTMVTPSKCRGVPAAGAGIYSRCDDVRLGQDEP